MNDLSNPHIEAMQKHADELDFEFGENWTYQQFNISQETDAWRVSEINGSPLRARRVVVFVERGVDSTSSSSDLYGLNLYVAPPSGSYSWVAGTVSGYSLRSILKLEADVAVRGTRVIGQSKRQRPSSNKDYIYCDTKVAENFLGLISRIEVLNSNGSVSRLPAGTVVKVFALLDNSPDTI